MVLVSITNTLFESVCVHVWRAGGDDVSVYYLVNLVNSVAPRWESATPKNTMYTVRQQQSTINYDCLNYDEKKEHAVS